MTEVSDDIQIEEIETLGDDQPAPVSDDYDSAAVPNFIAAQPDIDRLRAHLTGQDAPEGHIPLQEVEPVRQAHITMPHVRPTPLNEFNRSQALLSLAFPSLYPNGQADYIAPRQRSIRYDDYIEHALKHYDGRFARHPRFRYTCFNTLMRQQVNSRSSFFIKKGGPQAGHEQPIDISEICAAFDADTAEAKSLLNSIVRYSNSLRGTRAYWGGRRHQLEAYVRGLGCPGVFLTFSAADLHWDSLQQHFPRYDEWLEADHRTKMTIAGANLRENPHIAAYHFILALPVFSSMSYSPSSTLLIIGIAMSGRLVVAHMLTAFSGSLAVHLLS